MDQIHDFEQLAKRVDWLDSERRNDKTTIATLQSQLNNLENENTALKKQLTSLESELNRNTTMLAHIDQFEMELARVKKELKQQIDDFQQNQQIRLGELEKNRKLEMGVMSKALADVHKSTDVINGIQQSLKARQEEEFRLARLIEEVKLQVKSTEQGDEEKTRSFQLLEENRRQDARRVTDLQGEMAILRKKQDENRGRIDLTVDGVRKFESKINEMLSAESERLQVQNAFIEKANMQQVERDKVFKEWAARFESVEKILSGMEASWREMETTHRAIKQSQSSMDEITTRFERRINEITEIQRLNEDRFRQEWTTFKADDLKRWTNFSLTQDEQHRELNRLIEKLAQDVQLLDDHLQKLDDQVVEDNQSQLRLYQDMARLFTETIDIKKQFLK